MGRCAILDRGLSWAHDLLSFFHDSKAGHAMNSPGVLVTVTAASRYESRHALNPCVLIHLRDGRRFGCNAAFAVVECRSRQARLPTPLPDALLV